MTKIESWACKLIGPFMEPWIFYYFLSGLAGGICLFVASAAKIAWLSPVGWALLAPWFLWLAVFFLVMWPVCLFQEGRERARRKGPKLPRGRHSEMERIVPGDLEARIRESRHNLVFHRWTGSVEWEFFFLHMEALDPVPENSQAQAEPPLPWWDECFRLDGHPGTGVKISPVELAEQIGGLREVYASKFDSSERVRRDFGILESWSGGSDAPIWVATDDDFWEQLLGSYCPPGSRVEVAPLTKGASVYAACLGPVPPEVLAARQTRNRYAPR